MCAMYRYGLGHVYIHICRVNAYMPSVKYMHISAKTCFEFLRDKNGIPPCVLITSLLFSVQSFHASLLALS